MLLEHEGAFPGEAVDVGSEVFVFALGEAVEVLGQHVIGNKEDDIWTLGGVCHSLDAWVEEAQGGDDDAE